jgi:hypothetical protein
MPMALLFLSVRFLVSASSTPLKMSFLVTVMFSKCIRVSDCLHTSITSSGLSEWLVLSEEEQTLGKRMGWFACILQWFACDASTVLSISA